jgi:predicted dehydrogenase
VLQQSRATLVAVADPRAEARAAARTFAPEASVVSSLEDAIALGVDAAVLATSSPSHAALARAALEAGLDVLVEKPLAMSAAAAAACVEAAHRSGRVAMVGHLLRYHPTVTAMIELARSGALGAIVRLEAARLSMGGGEETAALWALGPHDLSILAALDESPVVDISLAPGSNERHARLDVRLASGTSARIDLSREHATKERRIVIVGSEGSAALDDVRAPDRIARWTASGAALEPIRVAWREPLAAEIEHFLDCIDRSAEPLTPFSEGAAVVALLERAEQSSARRRRTDCAPHLEP